MKKDNKDKYIYFNQTSGFYRIMVWRDGKQLYLGTYSTIEAAREARDEMFPDKTNPFAKQSHPLGDSAIKERAKERLEKMKKLDGVN